MSNAKSVVGTSSVNAFKPIKSFFTAGVLFGGTGISCVHSMHCITKKVGSRGYNASRAMHVWDIILGSETIELAMELFAQNKNNYHSVVIE